MTMLKIKEVATGLRVSSQTVRRMLRSGSLSGIAVGSTYRIDAAELSKYIADHQTRPETRAKGVSE